MRNVILIFLLFLAFGGYAQNPISGSEVRVKKNDSTTVFVPTDGGTLTYLAQINEWRAWINGVSTNPFKGANNGMSSTFGYYQLGGNLIKNTTIGGAGFQLVFGLSGNRLSTFAVNSSGLAFINGGSGAASLGLDSNGADFTVSSVSNQFLVNTSGVSTKGDIARTKTKLSHGFAVGDWLTIDGTGAFVKGSDPSAQAFVGIVSAIINSNEFRYVSIGESISGLTGLTAGQIYYAQPDGTISLTSSPKPVLIATSTTAGVLLSGSFGTTIPPPSQQSSLMTFSNITSTSATATVTRGNGNGVLMVLAQEPATQNPANNQFYNADPVFGSGDALGSAFVVFAENGSSVNITGLTPGTSYQGVAYEYSSSGFFISYNTNAGTNGFVTLADATTPTQQWVTTNIRSEEDRLRIQGIRGNGDNIVVVASTEGPPDTDISDGTNPTAGAYGAGTAVGNGYVVYEGSAHDFHITGFPTRDRMVWFKIMEREDTEFLYNTQAAIDSAWLALIYDSLFIVGSAPAGQTYLEANAEAFYDFAGRLTGADGAAISNGNAGLEDYGPGAYTGTIVNTPLVQETTISSQTVKTMEANTSNGAVNSGHSGTDWIQGNDFEIWYGVEHQDGQHGGTNYYFGGSNTGATTLIRVESINTGHLRIVWTNTGGNFTWQSTNAVFANGVNAHKVIRIRFDFTADALTVYDNGSTVAGSFTAGNISSASSASWSNDQTLLVGQYRTSGGSTFGQATAFFMTRFAITGLLSSGDASDVLAYFNYLPSGAAFFDNWTPVENNGFTYSVIDDTLNLSGNPTGFQDYILRDEIIPDTLQEFDAKYTFKIADALSSSTAGTGPIVINDLSSEANRAVYVLFVTNTASNNFGKLQLYSGDGTVASPTSIVFRSQTSGAFVPAEDSVYSISLSPTVNGANLLWTAKIIDLYDSAELTTSWLETNAPSSAFLGSTTQVGIWQNGGPFKISPFSVVRTGLDLISAPPPGGGGGGTGTVNYEVFVDVNGSDANSCTEALPCRTAVRAAERVNELGSGAEPDVFFGPGTFTESALVFWPSFTDTIDGAGDTQTFFKGASNLYTQVATSGNGSPFSSYGYLFNFSSASSTNVTTVMRNFTMDGNRDVGGYSASMKGAIYVNNRDQINLDNVDIKHFWSVGMWLQNVDSLVYRNGHFRRNGFSNPITGITYSLGNLECFGTNTRIWLIDSFIDSPTFNEGRGMGHSGAPNFYRFDFHAHGNEWVTGGSSDAEDHHFAVEILQYFMNSGDSISFKRNIFRKNVSLNYTGTELGTHYFANNQFVFDVPRNLAIEAQVGNLIVENNYFSNIVGKAIGTYNGWNVNCPRDCNAANQVWDGMIIRNNIFEQVAATLSGDAIWGDQLWRRDDVLIENNTVQFTTTSGAIYRLVRGGTQGVNDNWIVQNNAIHGQPSAGSTVWSTANGSTTFTNSFFRYNKATNLVVTQLLSGDGMTESNNTVTGSGNTLGFNLTGSHYPVVGGSFWAWLVSNTVLRNTGFGGADIGAYED